jgi:hypothetical protein
MPCACNDIPDRSEAAQTADQHRVLFALPLIPPTSRIQSNKQTWPSSGPGMTLNSPCAAGVLLYSPARTAPLSPPPPPDNLSSLLHLHPPPPGLVTTRRINKSCWSCGYQLCLATGVRPPVDTPPLPTLHLPLYRVSPTVNSSLVALTPYPPSSSFESLSLPPLIPLYPTTSSMRLRAVALLAPCLY